MAVKTLLVTRISGLEQALEAAHLSGIDVTRTKSDEATAEAISEAEIILADPVVVAPHLGKAKSLKWLQSNFAGVEVLFQEGSRSDYLLTRMKGLFGPQMVEYVLGHILVRERQVFRRMVDQSQKVWGPRGHRQLSELTMGILGIGDIGMAVAQAAKQFGMTVWGLRSTDQKVAGVDRIFNSAQLDSFLAGCDYVVNILPSTPATVGLLSGERLKACKTGAVLINIGRGDVIDEDSIAYAIHEGWIEGAVLDVFETEPLPRESPLWDLPGVIITPHVAALSYPEDTVKLFAANLEKYLAGKPLDFLVDWDKGY